MVFVPDYVVVQGRAGAGPWRERRAAGPRDGFLGSGLFAEGKVDGGLEWDAELAEVRRWHRRGNCGDGDG
jgi:hypothetical protein